MSYFLHSLTVYSIKITKSGKMSVPLQSKSLFLEMDNLVVIFIQYWDLNLGFRGSLFDILRNRFGGIFI